MAIQLSIEDVLSAAPAGAGLEVIGHSRQGREIRGRVYGHGTIRVSLIGGCHADEPVGPAMLERLCGHLETLEPGDPLLSAATWFVVPHVNPDGREVNRSWSDQRLSIAAADGSPDSGFDIGLYLERVVRELPGDDVEFGFPRDAQDDGMRPENRNVADFLGPGAPFTVHGTFHGMALAPGPWFLLEAAWVGRTPELRHNLRRLVRRMGYELFDIDRGGEKGFSRIDEGFSTRPDSEAMRDHFLRLRDPATAALFRPSSMELVRSMGGDPLTFVSENPLFLLPRGESTTDIKPRLAALAAAGDPATTRLEAERMGVRAMPIGDQMRLQLAFLNEALAAVATG